MKEFIQKIRDKIMATEDTVCLQRAYLVTEAYQKYDDEPIPVKRAKAFAYILRNMDLDMTSNPIFAGNTSSKPRAWLLLPEYGMNNDTQVVLENESLANILDGKIPKEIGEYWADKNFGGSCGIGHLAVDLDAVVNKGLKAMIAEAENHPADDPERQIYRKAMAITLQAVIDWAGRYAECAENEAKKENDPLIREAHIRVAKACRHVSSNPARNLFEALQAIVLVHLAIAIEGHGMSVSIGLPDRVLAEFIDGNFNSEYATNLISAFMLKINCNSIFGRGSKTQAITVGGLNHLGEDQCNDLTLCFLEACNRMRIGDPHLFVRWNSRIDTRVKQRAMDMLASGVSMPLLISDITAQGFINAGIPEKDAWDFCVIGCNELGIPGRLMESATAMNGNIQYLELLNRVLHEKPDIGSMEDLLASLENIMTQTAMQMRKNGQNHKKRMAELVPTPFTSALMRNCIDRGQDLLIGMDYQLAGLYERGLTNAVNALSAMQKVVFDEKTLSMSKLVDAMKSNFQDASVRSKLLNVAKWGNNDPVADKWALELVDMRERVLDRVDREFGSHPHTVCHVVRSLHHVDGKRITASPDGRFAYTPVADSIGAQTGTAFAGPTAVLNSVLKLNASDNYRGGYNLNLTFQKTNAEPESLQALVETFFDEGGQELQINCLDADMLCDARRNPQAYGDLVVRVAGFSARFVDLSRAEQDELIERARAAT